MPAFLQDGQTVKSLMVIDDIALFVHHGTSREWKDFESGHIFPDPADESQLRYKITRRFEYIDPTKVPNYYDNVLCGRGDCDSSIPIAVDYFLITNPLQPDFIMTVPLFAVMFLQEGSNRWRKATHINAAPLED